MIDDKEPLSKIFAENPTLTEEEFKKFKDTSLQEFTGLPSALAVGKQQKNRRQSTRQPFIRQRGALPSSYYRWTTKAFAVSYFPRQMIRPKCICNFCLFHDCFGDIAICFDALSYHLQLIWTNLLTQCPVPVSIYFCPSIADKGEK